MAARLSCAVLDRRISSLDLAGRGVGSASALGFLGQARPYLGEQIIAKGDRMEQFIAARVRDDDIRRALRPSPDGSIATTGIPRRQASGRGHQPGSHAGVLSVDHAQDRVSRSTMVVVQGS